MRARQLRLCAGRPQAPHPAAPGEPRGDHPLPLHPPGGVGAGASPDRELRGALDHRQRTHGGEPRPPAPHARPTAAPAADPAMSHGLLPYTIETVPDGAGLTSRAGLPLVLETMHALGLPRAIRTHIHLRERQSGYTETQKLEALVLLLAAGGDCLDDIAVLQGDGGLGRLLGRRFPSAD